MDNTVCIVVVPGVTDKVKRYIVVNNIENLYTLVNKSLDVLVCIDLCFVEAVCLLLDSGLVCKKSLGCCRVIFLRAETPEACDVGCNVFYETVCNLVESLGENLVGNDSCDNLNHSCLFLVHKSLKEAVVKEVCVKECEVLSEKVADD